MRFLPLLVVLLVSQGSEEKPKKSKPLTVDDYVAFTKKVAADGKNVNPQEQDEFLKKAKKAFADKFAGKPMRVTGEIVDVREPFEVEKTKGKISEKYVVVISWYAKHGPLRIYTDDERVKKFKLEQKLSMTGTVGIRDFLFLELRKGKIAATD